MKKRKKIAVIAADVFNDYMNRILVGISEQCKVLGYDVLSFLMAFRMPVSSSPRNMDTIAGGASFAPRL